ncbi:MAG TPA: VanZ family protein [Verrucomicrobiota bacterium]|nr:VanZ family protein [Verrucomicrobiota bacterium]
MRTSPSSTKINPWVWVAAWMGVIFFFSTDLFSGPQTSRVIGPFLKWFMPDVSDETIRDIRLVIRKAAHVLEYAILSILSCRALAQRAAPSPLPLAALGQAVLIASAYAVLDEWHQSWTAERFGSPLDVAIDSVGATVGAAFFAWLSRRKTGTTSP